MSLVAVGTNHKYSPMAFREKISFSKKRLKAALDFLREGSLLKGAVILSTCNRVEIYASAEDPEIGAREIEDFISRYYEIDKRTLSPYLYIYKDREAFGHLIRVASGLDSLILGETQIFGQVKSSLIEAEGLDFVDRPLKRIFYSAASITRRIHRETGITDGKVSVGSVAVEFIKEKIGILSGKKILIIGIGKVTELTLRYLRQEEPEVVFISNRTFKKARELAAQIGARAVRFDDLSQALKEADVIITATASPHFIIKREKLRDIKRRLLIVDLAMPRDVDPGVREMENVELFCLEDLDRAIKKNMAKKKEQAQRAKAIIDIEAERLWEELIGSEPETALSR